jgi:hypothetical protein
MNKHGKAVSLALLLLIMAASLITVKPISAQATPNPPVPNFSIDFVEHSYVVPENISIDPYTGEKSTIPTHNVTTLTLTVTVTNSPSATAYLLGVKGHYTSNWFYPMVDDPMYGNINITAFASSDAQTTITLSGYDSGQILLGYSDHWSITVPSGGKLDFRLEAINGHVGSRMFGGTAYFGESSDWSSIQTVSFPANVPLESTPTPSIANPDFSQAPTDMPTQSGSNSDVSQLNWVQVATLVLVGVTAVLLVFVVFYLRKRSLK